MRRLTSFTVFAVTRNKGLILQTFVRVVDFFQFVGNNCQQFSLSVSCYADFNFSLIVVFDDFGTSLVFVEYNAAFPNEPLLFNRPLAKVELTPLNPPVSGGRNLTPSPFRGGLGRGFKDLCKRSNPRVCLNDEAGENTFGHELVFVAQD